MKIFLCILLCMSILPLSNSVGQDRLSGKTFTTRSEVIARNGMAATNHPIASQIAIEVLKNGGTAVDAAIAANAFLGFADPGMNGIGGDLFAIVWDAKTKKLYGPMVVVVHRSHLRWHICKLKQKNKIIITRVRFLSRPLDVWMDGLCCMESLGSCLWGNHDSIPFAMQRKVFQSHKKLLTISWK